MPEKLKLNTYSTEGRDSYEAQDFIRLALKKTLPAELQPLIGDPHFHADFAEVCLTINGIEIPFIAVVEEMTTEMDNQVKRMCANAVGQLPIYEEWRDTMRKLQHMSREIVDQLGNATYDILRERNISLDVLKKEPADA